MYFVVIKKKGADVLDSGVQGSSRAWVLVLWRFDYNPTNHPPIPFDSPELARTYAQQQPYDELYVYVVEELL